MAITAVEHAEFAPRNPLSGCVIDDRYIVTMAYNSSTAGGTTPTDYAVFDAVTETSNMYSFPLRNIDGQSMVPYNGYAWAIGREYAGTNFVIARINPVSGGYTLFTVASGARGNTAWIYYQNGWFLCSVLNTYDAPQDARSHFRVNATTMIASGLTGAGIYNKSTSTMAGYGDTVWTAQTGSGFGGIRRRGVAMSTGVVTDLDGTSSFPGGGPRVGTTLYTGGIFTAPAQAWDMSTETMIRTLPDPLGAMDVGPDGLLYSVNTTTVQAVDGITGASRTETFPVTRLERSLVFRANGKLWTPSGYPL